MNKTQPSWWHFSHEADMGIAAAAPSLNEVFEQCAKAMTAIVTDQPIADTLSVEIRCEAPDLEDLLVEWLNNLVFEMATNRVLFSRFQVRIEDRQLHAIAWGEPIDRARHQPAVEIKGATYTALRVWLDENGLWQARCVVDV